MGKVVAKQQKQTARLIASRSNITTRPSNRAGKHLIQQRGSVSLQHPALRGQSALALAILLVATVLALFGIILLISQLTSPRRGGQRVEVASQLESIEKVYIGRSGNVGLLMRGTGPAFAGKFRRATEGRALAVATDEMIVRVDAYNFSETSVPLVEGEWVIRLGDCELRPLPSKGETDPPSPVHAALSGGDLDTPLAAREARRIGFVGTQAAFDTCDSASFRRGRIADEITLNAAMVSERALAEFDRAPGPVTLEKLLSERPSSRRNGVSK